LPLTGPSISLNTDIIITLVCIAASAAAAFFAVGGFKSKDERLRPVFRTRIDLQQMETFMETRKFEEGEAACRKVLETDPSDHEAQCYLAGYLAAQRRPDEAMAVLMKLASEPRPRDPWVFAQLGFLFAECGQNRLSAWALDRGLELFPRYTELLVSRSRLYLEEGDSIRALGADRLGALHVHDNDFRGDNHTAPFLGKIEWMPVLEALSDIGYRGDFTFECYSFFRSCPTEVLGEAARYLCSLGRYMTKHIAQI